MSLERKKILICSLSSRHSHDAIEKHLLANKFEVVRVQSFDIFLEKTRFELFHVFIISFESPTELSLFNDKTKYNFACRLTPKIFLGPPIQLQHEDTASILNQHFTTHTDPSLITDFCIETYSLFYKEPRAINIANFRVMEVLASLSLIKFSGEIGFEGENERSSVFFHRGKIVSASSSLEDTRFGQILLQYEIVSKDQIDKVLELLKNDRKRIGQLFVEEGFISNKKLLEMLTLQIRHIVIPLFSWDKGKIEIFFDEHDVAQEYPVELRPFRLIMEGIKLRLSEKELIDYLKPDILFIRNKYKIYSGWPLTPDEIVMLKEIGGNANVFKSVREIISRDHFLKIEWLRGLYGFSLFSLIDCKFGIPDIEATPRKKEKVIEDLFSDPNVKSVDKKGMSLMPFFIMMIIGVFLGAIFLKYTANVSAPKIAKLPVVPRAKVVEKMAVSQPPIPTPDVATKIESPVLATSVLATPIAAKKVTPKKSNETTPEQKTVTQIEKELRQGHYQVAEKMSHGFLKTHPTHQKVLEYLAQAYMEQEKLILAQKTYQQILRMNPKQSKAHLNLGTIYIYLEKNELARTHLKNYLSLVKPVDQKARDEISEVKKVLQSLEASR